MKIRNNRGQFIGKGEEAGHWKGGGIKKCLICQQEFYTYPFLVKKGNGKYCSRKCAGISKLGRSSWNKGLHPEYVTGKNNYQWKGENVSYSGLHRWVIRNLGHPYWCTRCFSMQNVEWANISRQYKRDLNDWIQLCHKCHFKYDQGENWGKAAKLYIRRNGTHYTERIL